MRNFDSISWKLDWMVSTMENWRCTIFGLDWLNGEGEGEIKVTQIPEFWENEKSDYRFC